jgi:hypothetical protein
VGQVQGQMILNQLICIAIGEKTLPNPIKGNSGIGLGCFIRSISCPSISRSPEKN